MDYRLSHCIFVYFQLIIGVICANIDKNLSDVLFRSYDKALRPNCENVSLVNMTIGLAVNQVISLDEPNQVVKLNLWMRLKWNDCLLTWNPNDFNGIESLVVPIEKIWYPDLTLYDSTSTDFSGMKEYRPMITYDGTVYYNFPSILESLCPIDVRSFPFDTQICPLTFGSWNHHGKQIDIYPKEGGNAGDISSMETSVEWLLPKIPVVRHVIMYECCPAPYPDVTFYIHLERKPGYYVSNILIPSIMITVLSILGYFLPVDSGEKVSLVVTVMLAMSVFQLLVADKLPPSADATPLIVFFFNFILGMSAVSTFIQVVVINIYYRGDRAIPHWLMDYFIRPLCCGLFVEIPGGMSYKRICGKKIDTEDSIVFTKPPKNDNVWRAFSVAIDRLGILMFTLTLAIGCGCILDEMT